MADIPLRSDGVPLNYIYPSNARRLVRIFAYPSWTAVPTTTTYYTVPQDKILKIQQVIITSRNGLNWTVQNCGVFFRSQDGSEISSFAEDANPASYNDTVYNFDEKLILYGGDTITSYTVNALGVGSFLYAVVFGVEEMNPYLYPTKN